MTHDATGSSELVTQARAVFSSPWNANAAYAEIGLALCDRVEELEAQLTTTERLAGVLQRRDATRISGLVEELDFIGDLRGRVSELETALRAAVETLQKYGYNNDYRGEREVRHAIEQGNSALAASRVTEPSDSPTGTVGGADTDARSERTGDREQGEA